MALHMTYVGPWNNVLKMGVPNTHSFGFHPLLSSRFCLFVWFVGLLVGLVGLLVGLVCLLVGWLFVVAVVVFLFVCF